MLVDGYQRLLCLTQGFGVQLVVSTICESHIYMGFVAVYLFVEEATRLVPIQY